MRSIKNTVLVRFLMLTAGVVLLTHSFAVAQNGNGVPPELKISLETRERMNEFAAEFGLHRVTSVQKLNQLYCAGAVIKISNPLDLPVFYLDRESPGVRDYPYLRPFAAGILNEIAGDFFREHGYPLKITSLTRTVPYQVFLEGKGTSDARESNPKLRSAHPDGNAFDIAKALSHRLMNSAELKTLRQILSYREQEGAIDAIEENGSFHVTVSPAYAVRSDSRFIPDDKLLELGRDEECREIIVVKSPAPSKMRPGKMSMKKGRAHKKSPKHKS